MTVVPPRRVIRYASSSARTEPASSNAYSTPPPVASRIFSTVSAALALNVCVAPSDLRELELRIREIDGDDLPRAGRARAKQRREPHAAEADHRDRRARAHLRGVDDRAHAGEHRASEQRGFVERKLGVDLHHRTPRHDGVIREHRAAEMVIDRLAVLRQPSCARQQRAGAIRRGAGFAQRRPAFGTRRAVAAARHEHHDDVVAALQVGDAVAERLDDSRRFVAERHRHRARPIAVDHRKIGVAQARGGDLHEHLAGTGRRELQRLDRERASLRERRLRAHRVQHGCVDLHRSSSAIATALTAASRGSSSAR